MGAILEPSPAMSPWYSVEIRRESAYVGASVYENAAVRMVGGERDVTDEELAAAWRVVDEDTTLAPSPPAALAAALTQIVSTDTYRRWPPGAGHSGGAGAVQVDGRLLVTAPNSYRYGPTDESGIVSTVEFAYADIAPILADLERMMRA
ncbi:hypothetical protein [Streptomyces sp. NPDC053560]|uniref:hypothetical protein n=1 Tax=Streptomyces sp. NPDC053560 TaxID=3365711 RepID=UPI0037D0DBDB